MKKMNRMFWQCCRILSAVIVCLLLLSICSCDQKYCSHTIATVSRTEPTCEMPGYTHHVCATCGYIWKTDFIEPMGHDYVETIVPPTCEDSEMITYACNTCGETFTVNGSAPLGHTWEKAVENPTCTTEGHTTYTCSVCLVSYAADETAPTGHAFEVNVVPPTCTAEGYTVYACVDCPYSTISERLPAKGHEYVRTVTPPTTQQMGNVTYACALCTGSDVERYIQVSDVLTGAAGDGSGALAIGVDLSSHNGDVDFTALAQKVDYVILRAGTTNLSIDSKFEEYYAAAKAAGLDVGCYYASYAMNEKEMAADVIRLLKVIDGKTFEYPICLDIEKDEQRNIGKQKLTDMISLYMEAMLDAGWFPALYTNADFLKVAMDDDFVLNTYDVWFAGYKYGANAETLYSAMYGMWQYSNTGAVDGVSGKVDLDYAFKEYPAIISYYKLNGK